VRTRWRWRWSLSLVTAGACLLAVRPAQSAEKSAALELVWDATVFRTESGAYRLRLQTAFRGESRIREVEGSSCEAVGSATALMLAFLLDPEAAAAQVQEEAPAPAPSVETVPAVAEPPAPLAQPVIPLVAPVSPVATPTPRSAPDAAVERDTSPPSAARSRKLWFAGLATGIDSGALPGTTASVALVLGRNVGPLALEAELLRLWPREQRLRSDPNRGGKFELWALGLDACYQVAWSRLALGPCLGVESGTLYGSGFGVDTPQQGKGLWLDALGMLAGRYRVADWFGARLQAGIAVPFTRPVYVLDNVGTVYQADFMALRAGAGVEAYF